MSKKLCRQYQVDHNIIHIHNNSMWDWQYLVEYFIIHTECEEYSIKYS